MRQKMMMVAALVMSVVAWGTEYEWKASDGSTNLNDIRVTQEDTALTFQQVAAIVTYCGAYLPRASDNQWAVVVPGKNLADYEVFKTIYGANKITGNKCNHIGGTAYPTYVETDEDGIVTMQLMTFDGVYTKGVKLALRQNGENIEGQVIWAKYITGDYLGEDFETLSGVKTYTIVTGDGTSGYGIDYLFFRTLSSQDSVRVTEGGTIETLAVKVSEEDLALNQDLNRVVVKADVGALDQEGDVLPAQMVLSNGTVAVMADLTHAITMTSAVTTTYGTIQMTADDEENEGSFTTEHAGLIAAKYSSATGVIRLFNTQLSDVIAVEGWMSGSSLWAAAGYHTNGCFFVNDGQTARCQFQAPSGDYIKCVKMEMRQNGPDVEVITPYACWIDCSKEGYESYYRTVGVFDFYDNPLPYNKYGEASASSYCLTNLVVTYRTKAYRVKPKVTLGGSWQGTGSELYLEGVYAMPTVKTAFPKGTGALVHVATNAYLDLNYEHGNTGGFNGGAFTFRVDAGGTLRGGATWAIGNSQGVDIYGGRVIFDATMYCASFNFYDGGEIGGTFTIRTGLNPDRNSNRRIYVTGTKPISMSNNLDMVCTSSNTVYEFKIDDVTGDASPDFTFSGKTTYFYDPNQPGKHDHGQFVKKGKGTMRMSGTCSCTSAPFEIQAGLLEWMASGVAGMNGDVPLPITLAGGNFAVADGTVNNCGTLKVTQDATLTIGAGAALTFTDVADWTADKMLNVTAGDGAKIRIGTSKDDLPVDIRHAIRINGERVMVDKNGYVKPWSGMSVIIR